MIYLVARKYLKKFSAFAQIQNPIVLREISKKLQPKIYLDRDYVIYRNLPGSEMYFIVGGSVDVLDPSELKRTKTLRSGYFGEFCLLSTVGRRTRSIISRGMTQIYSFSRSDFQEITKSFPSILKIFLTEMEHRVRELEEKEKALKQAKEDPLEDSDLQEISPQSSEEESDEKNQNALESHLRCGIETQERILSLRTECDNNPMIEEAQGSQEPYQKESTPQELGEK